MRPAIRGALVLSAMISLLGLPQAIEAAEPIRGVLQELRLVTPDALTLWKSQGVTTIVVPLDESISRTRWAEVAGQIAAVNLKLYAWIEIGRDPALAEAHPEWMASPGGHHDDWRRRFPHAPTAKEGEVIKAWPWVPIGYAPAFEAHLNRVRKLLDHLPGPYAGVFLNDLQAGPSSCGCGNDQCRWALDYGSTPTAPKTRGDDVAARFVATTQRDNPGKSVIPVWVTECELIDLPRVAGSTGFCGNVECAKNTCWVSYASAWNPLLQITSGPVAVAIWPSTFGRSGDWAKTGIALFEAPPRGGQPVAKDRVIAIVEGWEKPESDFTTIAGKVQSAQGGWVIALSKIDQSWEPRLIKWPR